MPQAIPHQWERHLQPHSSVDEELSTKSRDRDLHRKSERLGSNAEKLLRFERRGTPCVANFLWQVWPLMFTSRSFP